MDQPSHPIDSLPEYAAGLLEASAIPAIENHLAECEMCRAWAYELVMATRPSISESAPASAPVAPAGS